MIRKSFLFFCRYDVELYQRIEQLIGKKLPLYPTVEEEVMLLMERVTEAQRYAKMVRGCRELPSVFFLSQHSSTLFLCSLVHRAHNSLSGSLVKIATYNCFSRKSLSFIALLYIVASLWVGGGVNPSIAVPSF